MTTRKTILLVEDNVSDEKLTLLAFKSSGMANEIVVKRDGKAALDHLFSLAGAVRGSNALPAVVLLDLKLPRIDGLEVLRQVRTNERTKLVPIVVLTSSKEEEDIIRSYSHGANAYVRKPMDFGEFAATAKTIGLFWLVCNEMPPNN